MGVPRGSVWPKLDESWVAWRSGFQGPPALLPGWVGMVPWPVTPAPDCASALADQVRVEAKSPVWIRRPIFRVMVFSL